MPNPAGASCTRPRRRNLRHQAAVAQRYAAIAYGQAGGSGRPGSGFLPPPMPGSGAAERAPPGQPAAPGPGRSPSRAGVWGAVPGAGTGSGHGAAATRSADTEDDDVWTGGAVGRRPARRPRLTATGAPPRGSAPPRLARSSRL